jgi:hypothetical protein
VGAQGVAPPQSIETRGAGTRTESLKTRAGTSTKLIERRRTVTATEAVAAPTDAVIVVLPTAIAVIVAASREPATVATLGSLLVQTTVAAAVPPMVAAS